MTLINVSDIVTDPDFAQTLVVRRTSGSFDDYGRWESDTPTEINVVGSWQRVSAKELVQLGMGEIKQEVRKLLTPTEIKVSEDDDLRSDRIIWNQSRYKVLKVDDNSDYGYYRAYATFEGNE